MLRPFVAAVAALFGTGSIAVADVSPAVLKEIASIEQTCGVPTQIIVSSDLVAFMRAKVGLMICAASVLAIHKKLVGSFEAERVIRKVTGCDKDRWSAFVGEAELHEAALLRLASNMKEPMNLAFKLAAARELDPGVGSEIFDATKRSITSAAEIALTVADDALKAGCLSAADRKYRQVLTTFSQSSQDFLGNQRQRAQIGIDDVRARNGILCRLLNYC